MRRRSSLVWFLAAPAAAVHAPAPAFAADYLTAEQAQDEMFPGAIFEKREVALTPDERRALEQRLGGPLRDRWVVRVARRGGQVVGALVVDDVIGKFERITYAVGVGSDGAVRDV